MKSKLLAMVLLGGSSLWAGSNFNIGISIGNQRPGRYVVQPPPPPAPRYAVPRSPGRNYVWVPGYWAWAGNRYVWQNGFWTRQNRGRGNGYGNGNGYGYGR
jgi:hypothetical protein